jgi:hypothetical protein
LLTLHRVHKAILASGSKYFIKIFVEFDSKILSEADIPRPIPTSQDPFAKCIDDYVNLILKYIYSNQEIGSIREEVTERRASHLFSQAYVMGCHKLLKDVGAIVIEKYLNAENVLEYYLDAIKFDNEVVARACEMIILENLDTVMQTEQGSKFILNLPVKYMISICKNNRLRVSSENALA